MTKIQLRRDTAANWSTNNPTPSAGEPCFETDTGKLKIGDGTTAYTQLAYFSAGDSGLEICDIGMALYVDETKGLRRYLNGQIVDVNTNTQAFLNRLKEITTLHPSLLCTEEEWQTAKTMSAFGQVGKFVFNYSGNDIVSVRIPAIVNVQGLFDLQNLGMTVSAGLPNITGTAQTAPGRAHYVMDGALAIHITQNATEVYSSVSPATATQYGIRFDASRSNPIYGKSNTVQPEAIQYPYFIQIATGSETENNIINDIELNNPYSLFDSKYSDHELNNLSWLKSSGQWNAKAVYADAYDKLLKVQNGTETVEGLSVKLSTETYTDYDFVLNTANTTFRLPLKTLYSDVTVDSLSLYYYVGETVQNANLIDAGRIGELVATKTNMLQASGAGMPSDKYIDLALGASGAEYTPPANGWVYIGARSNGSNAYINTLGSKNPLLIFYEVRGYEQGTLMSLIFPVRKGEAFVLRYANFMTTDSDIRFRFVYAEGSSPTV